MDNVCVCVWWWGEPKDTQNLKLKVAKNIGKSTSVKFCGRVDEWTGGMGGTGGTEVRGYEGTSGRVERVDGWNGWTGGTEVRGYEWKGGTSGRVERVAE